MSPAVTVRSSEQLRHPVFACDAQDRLTPAWTDAKGLTKATAGQLAQCATSRPTAATIGGPAPYWTDWQFDQRDIAAQRVGA
ncbi:hypothetical protein AB0N16_04550 [Streptomyces sp. NPDC051105]|uniref:hypothetical protein n=1 Tax=Streptomyces sp. NPDC051105 TaxID=3154843 RepID=UPI00341B9D98